MDIMWLSSLVVSRMWAVRSWTFAFLINALNSRWIPVNLLMALRASFLRSGVSFERPLGGVRDLHWASDRFLGLCHDGVNRAGPDASGQQVHGALEAHRVGWVMEHPEGF